MMAALNAPCINNVRDIIPKIYTNSRIGYRYMSIPDFTPKERVEGDEIFFNNNYDVPIQKRLEKFREVAVPLVTDVCKKALEKSGVPKENITKLIIVSSTGFLGPGLDCDLIKTLGLNRSIDRSLIGFMGCAAAMNGFRTANDHVKSGPNKHALMICVEISSVHTLFGDNINDVIIHAIFADGCSVAVISGETRENIPKDAWVISDDHCWLLEDTEDGVVLFVNDNGISCNLSKYLPQYVAKNIYGYVEGFLAKNNLKIKDVDFWAVHPGGRRIIEEVQNGLNLTEEDCEASWEVLYNYGNMLSPTVMFVLERIFFKDAQLKKEGKPGYKNGLAFSFSPGVGAEGILIQRL